MKNYRRLLGHSTLYVLGGLIAGCAIVALLIFAWTFFKSDVSYSNFAAGWAGGFFISMFAFMLGFFPAFIYGAPAYAALLYRGYANYVTATLIGALPGLVLLPFDKELGFLFIIYGVPVALCTHLIAIRHRVGANNSFKPTPLRGAT